MAIKRIRLFVNNNEESLKNSIIIANKFNINGFTITDTDAFDLAIAVGGDGSFLRMVKENKFNSEINYVGINSGHLGFLQEVTMDDLDKFIEELILSKYKVDDVSIQKTKIITGNREEELLSLNEIIIRDILGKVVDLNISINNDLLEVYKGD